MTTLAPALATPVAPRRYVGLVTRALAFGVDAAVVNAVAMVAASVVSLTFSVVTVPEKTQTAAIAAGGALYLLWAAGYFVTFWATTGQTPGNRVMRIRVVAAEGGRLSPRRAIVRFAGLTLAALPLLLGFALILVTARRRGLHDLLARTVVVDVEAAERAGR